jgi:hypothetical protein
VHSREAGIVDGKHCTQHTPQVYVDGLQKQTSALREVTEGIEWLPYKCSIVSPDAGR